MISSLIPSWSVSENITFYMKVNWQNPLLSTCVSFTVQLKSRFLWTQKKEGSVWARKEHQSSGSADRCICQALGSNDGAFTLLIAVPCTHPAVTRSSWRLDIDNRLWKHISPLAARHWHRKPRDTWAVQTAWKFMVGGSTVPAPDILPRWGKSRAKYVSWTRRTRTTRWANLR